MGGTEKKKKQPVTEMVWVRTMEVGGLPSLDGPSTVASTPIDVTKDTQVPGLVKMDERHVTQVSYIVAWLQLALTALSNDDSCLTYHNHVIGCLDVASTAFIYRNHIARILRSTIDDFIMFLYLNIDNAVCLSASALETRALRIK